MLDYSVLIILIFSEGCDSLLAWT